MTRQEAQQSTKKDFGLSAALLSMTNSVTSEVLQTLKENAEHGVCQEILDQLYLDYDFQKPNEENIGKFKDTIFDALQNCFTPQNLRVLAKSNEDSGNYHLMYRTLRDYFTSKVEHQGRTKPAILTRIDDDETYAVIFREMAEKTADFAPKDPIPRKFMDTDDRKQQPDYNKIQENFER